MVNFFHATKQKLKICLALIFTSNRGIFWDIQQIPSWLIESFVYYFFIIL